MDHEHDDGSLQWVLTSAKPNDKCDHIIPACPHRKAHITENPSPKQSSMVGQPNVRLCFKISCLLLHSFSIMIHSYRDMDVICYNVNFYLNTL